MSPVRHSELETCFQLGCVLAGYGQHEKAIQAFLDMENHMVCSKAFKFGDFPLRLWSILLFPVRGQGVN